MKKNALRHFIVATLIATCTAAIGVRAQQGSLSAADKTRRWDTENELQSVAVVERKVMMPMPDGVRLATDIYRPKSAIGKVPTIWVRTPYNFNFWDVHNGVPADMTAALTAVKRGYAYVVQNERGHFFSEGNYDILGSRTDGYNAIDWLTKQPWSNGKIGTTGCSSTAEYQMGVAALGHPGYAAMNVQGFGAGVGRVGPYYEQGNWYRGGAMQMLFIAWLYGEQNQVRPMFPPDTSREDLIRASKSFDLAQHLPPVDWSKALWHLPVQDIIKHKEGTEVSGPITPTLFVSSDAKDTDFTVKVLDVYPDGRAYNLDESIQRMRYRDGYDKPLAWMESGKVYKVTLQPLTTSNYFAAGHKLRIEVSSSNFPRFDRNLNTGGNNYDEAKGVVAHNTVHHSKQYPSAVTVTVVKRAQNTSSRADR